MAFIAPILLFGITLAVVSGLMNGTFTVPMRYLGGWSWENVWAVFIIVSCVIMPVVIVAATMPDFESVLALAPARAVLAACVTGFAWGFGAIMFGLAVSAVGIALTNTLVPAVSASLGSFLPIVLLAPERLGKPQGEAIILGTLIGLAGIICCGYAGFLKERSQKGHEAAARGEMVGRARPFRIGLLLCIGAGVLSGTFNVGYALAQPILQTAVRTGHSAFAGSNLVWLLMLGSGAVANLCYCGWLLTKNSSWRKFVSPKAAPLGALAVLMGLLWGGSTFVYGAASPDLGILGPAIGWPLALITGLLTANFWGAVTGEWKLTRRKDRSWMAAGVLVLLIALATLGWSGTLG